VRGKRKQNWWLSQKTQRIKKEITFEWRISLKRREKLSKSHALKARSGHGVPGCSISRKPRKQLTVGKKQDDYP